MRGQKKAQSDANEAAICLLLHASPEVNIVNVTGPETAVVKKLTNSLQKRWEMIMNRSMSYGSIESLISL